MGNKRKNISYKKKNKRNKKKIKGGNIFKGMMDASSYPKRGKFKGEIDFVNGENKENGDNTLNLPLGANEIIPSGLDVNSVIQQGIPQGEDAQQSFDKMQASLESLDKPPIMHLVDYMLYTLYTIAGIFIYYPTFLVNFPDTTLENIIPTKDGCKTLIGDELMCKRKVKCFFKKCTMFEDPVGYKLEKHLQSASKRGIHRHKSRKVQKIAEQTGGAITKTRKKKEHKYLKYIPQKVKKAMKRAQKRELKDYLKLVRTIIKANKKGGKYFVGGNDAGSINIAQGMFKDQMSKMSPEVKNQIQQITKDMSSEEMKNLYKGFADKNTIGKSTPALEAFLKDKGLTPFLSKHLSGIGNIAANEIMRDKRANVSQSTCLNKVENEDGTVTTNHILCDNKQPTDYKSDEPNNNVLYKSLFGKDEIQRLKETTQKSKERLKTILSMGKSMKSLAKTDESLYGEMDMDPDSFVEPEMVQEFLKDYLDNDSVYKLLIAYKMLDSVFKDEITNEEMHEYNEDIPDEMYGVDVSFPWSTKNYFVTPEERRRCLFTHLTRSNLGDDYKSSDLYEKCFVCKNCTLANTSFKAWERVFDNLFTSSKTEFSTISSDLFQVMKKNFRFHLLPIKQYYLLSLLAMNFVHPMIDLQTLKIPISTKQGETYDLRDLILGIPQMSPTMQPSPLIKEQLRETYMMMKMMNIENTLYNMCFKMMYRKILKEDDLHVEKRLHEIKEQIKEKYNIFYGRGKLYSLLDNNVDFYELDNFNPIKNSQKLNDMNANTDVYGDKEIASALNDHFKKYVPLFQLILDKDQYDFAELYENHSDESVKMFHPIVFKINEIEKDEKDEKEE
jgi:hypothetical protein